jgi:hypothetical protein
MTDPSQPTLDRLWDDPDDPMHGPGICGCGEEDPWARGCPAQAEWLTPP